MKKILAIVALAIILALSFSGCSDGDLPDGMQLVRGGEEYGYYFFAPEEWTPNVSGSIASVHVSTLDNSSVTVASVADVGGELADYFKNDMKDLPYSGEIKLENENGVSCLWGGKTALKFVYTFTETDASGENEVSFKAMQILARHGSEIYILTFQSTTEMFNEEETYYSYYLEKVDLIISNFKFVEKKTSEKKNPEDTDGDGYYLASDPSVAGFELYLPNEYELEFATGMVSAKVADKNGNTARANISISRATSTNVLISNYINTRRDELSSLFDDFTDIAMQVKTGSEEDIKKLEGNDYLPALKGKISKNAEIEFGGLSQAFTYEYTYSYRGTTYHVYQVFGASSSNGFVFTYTADESCFEEYRSDIDEILSRIVFN